MKRKTKLAIVGRPNVGKSALFNRICGQRLAIVDEAEGVTRDRLYADAECFGLSFEVIDTGGIVPAGKRLFEEEIRRQAEIAIEEADAIIQVVDGQSGPTAFDEEISQLLFRSNKPVCLAINKIDHPSQQGNIHAFASLGIQPMIPVSAAHGWQIVELVEEALAPCRDRALPESDPEDRGIRVAIIGRPNVGKSSLVNYILEDERCIVSPVAGTTRDSIDVGFWHNDSLFTFIDTAGIRRKQAEHDVVDKFAALRTKRAIERADLCILLLDAAQGITVQEKRIARQIEEAGKGCILLLNKWDLMKGMRMEHGLRFIQEEISFLKHCPKLFISAKTGRNVEKIFPLLLEVYKGAQHRVPTHQLNVFLEQAVQKRPPPLITGKRLRIYYLAQVEKAPPTFALFVNAPHLLIDSYKKYLINRFREQFPFSGVPLVFHLKGRKQKHSPI